MTAIVAGGVFLLLMTAAPAYPGDAGIAHPIRSLSAESFEDLQFLRPILAGKRVVQLGESAHGVGEFNRLKVRLVKFLHQELGFDVIAFESSLAGCAFTDARIGTSSPLEVMRDCIFGTWHSAETLGLFEYLERTRAAGKPLTLAGFDVQNSGFARPRVTARLVDLADGIDPALARRIAEHEAAITGDPKKLDAEPMSRDYARLAEGIRGDSLMRQEALSRARFVRQLAAGFGDEGSAIRDEGMADNLEYLLDDRFPRRKVVVWAHNAHISHKALPPSGFRPMGQWLAERRRADLYTIALYMGRGTAAWNNRKPYAVAPPAAGTLEAILGAAGHPVAFMEAAGFDQPITARHWGRTPVVIVPAALFDALIFIDSVSPPAYL